MFLSGCCAIRVVYILIDNEGRVSTLGVAFGPAHMA